MTRETAFTRLACSLQDDAVLTKKIVLQRASRQSFENIRLWSWKGEPVHPLCRRQHHDLTIVKGCDVGATNRRLSKALGILDEDAGVAKRATFLVDPDGVIRFVYVTDMSVGRNPAEVLRVLDALQTDELCPCNWQKGEDVIKTAA